MRLVIDTNVAIAGLLWHGSPRKLLDAAVEGTIDLAISTPLIEELARALTYPKFARRLVEHGVSAEMLVAQYATVSERVQPATISRKVPHDPEDDRCSPALWPHEPT